MSTACRFSVLLLIVAAAVGPGNTRAQDWAKIAPDDLVREGNFGRDLAVMDSLLFVSDAGDSTIEPFGGAVRVFRLDSDSIRFLQKILPPFPDAYGHFGGRLTVDGNDLLVSASLRGTVYHFKVREGRFDFVDTLRIPEDAGVKYLYFGVSLLMSGDWAFIASQGEKIGTTVYGDSRGVVVFRRDRSGWEFHSVLSPDERWSRDSWYGTSICMASNTLAVSAQRDGKGGGRSGAVYLYENSGGEWKMVRKLKERHPEANRYFGSSIACGEDHVLVNAGGGNEVAVYSREGDNWNQKPSVLELELPAENAFGITGMYMYENWFFVQTTEHPLPYEFVGFVNAFRRVENHWLPTRRFSAPDRSTDDGFGDALVLTDEYLIVGAEWQDRRDENGNQLADESGAVYITKRGLFLPWNTEAPPVDRPERTQQISTALLERAYPNPASQHISIGYTVAEASPVTMEIFDVQGRLVGQPVRSKRTPGDYAADIDASAFPNGVYLCRIGIGRLNGTVTFVVVH